MDYLGWIYECEVDVWSFMGFFWVSLGVSLRV